MLFVLLLSINIATLSVTKWLKQDKIFEVIRWVLIFLIILSLLHLLFLLLLGFIHLTQPAKLTFISLFIKDAISVFFLYFSSRVFLQNALLYKQLDT